MIVDNIHHIWYGVYNMNRYQIYLDQGKVKIVEKLAQDLNMSRSQIIRDVLDRVIPEYEKLIKASVKIYNKNNPLLKMAGFAKSTTGRLSENVDEIYFRD